MKKLLSMLAVVMTLGLGAAHFDAEAKRIGGGKSLGMQRQATPPARTPDATPNAAPAAGAAAGTAAAASKRSWMGPIAGLATGLGIAALASHLGFGEELANMLMIGLLVMAVLAVIGFVMRKKAAQSGGGMAYAGAGAGAGQGQASNTLRVPATQPAPSFGQGGGSMIGSAIGANLPQQARIPADFDVAGFVRNAKVQFIRLQASNDVGNLDDIREFTSPEMFAEIQMDIRERNGATQETRVLDLNAEVLEVAQENARYVVSVLFTGRVQEDGAAPEDIHEVWHLTKPVSGSGGWVLAGIQQSA